MITTETKICRDCKIEKSVSEFTPHKRDRYTPYCKPCNALRTKTYRSKLDPQTLKAQKRRHHLKSAYGITLEEYDQMFAAQNGLCGICGEPPTPLNTRPVGLVVDHDHTTGNNRGLLCDTCNRAIGMLGDDPDRLLAAATCLIQHQGGL